MNAETAIQNALRIAASRLGWRLFRNNVGAFWTGSEAVRMADLIGWRPVTITPDMVGQTIAQFVSVEAKTRTGRPTDKQIKWKLAVNAAGGHAVIARDTAGLENANTDPCQGRS